MLILLNVETSLLPLFKNMIFSSVSFFNSKFRFHYTCYLSQ